MGFNFLDKYDRSFLNKSLFLTAKVLYHGTTLTYYNERMPHLSQYFFHAAVGLSGSKNKEVWFETNVKKAIDWACAFALRFKDKPVLLIVSTRSLQDLRRTVGHNWPYHRADKVPAKDIIMIELEFTSEKWKKRLFLSAWYDLTDACKEKIILAQRKLS